MMKYKVGDLIRFDQNWIGEASTDVGIILFIHEELCHYDVFWLDKKKLFTHHSRRFIEERYKQVG